MARLLPKPRQPAGNARKGAGIALRIESQVAGLLGKSGDDLEINAISSDVVRLDAMPEVPLSAAKQAIPTSLADQPPAAASRAWGKRPALAWQKFAVASGGLALVVFGLIFVLSRAVGRVEEAPVDVVVAQVIEVTDSSPGRAPVTEACGEEAREILTHYARAVEAAEVFPLIRDSGRLAERVAADWQAWDVPRDWHPAAGLPWSTGETAGRDFGVIEGMLSDQTPFRVYFIRTGDGRLQLDWEASTGKGDATFSDLVAGRIGGTIRARCQTADFHTEALPEVDYRCFKLASPCSHHAIWGYAPHGSPAAEILAESLADGAAAGMAVTVSLVRPPPGGMPQQWVIDELVHFEWVSPD